MEQLSISACKQILVQIDSARICCVCICVHSNVTKGKTPLDLPHYIAVAAGAPELSGGPKVEKFCLQDFYILCCVSIV